MNRKRQARWDGDNMKVLSTKLRKEDAEEIFALCKAEKRTVYALLKQLVTCWRDATNQMKQPFDCYKD